MRLFLIRHAHAEAAATDALRALSERGRQQTAHVASFFRHNAHLRPGQVWHSPLRRAYETANALVTGLEIDAPLVETDGLLPGDAPTLMATRLAAYPPVHDIALVGHEPHLGCLASLLVSNRASPSLFHFKKAAVLCLRRSDKTHSATTLPRWRVDWHLPPLLIPET
ncbi:SixA phosphatase family protein [Actomonas aquatica]|uniref:Histidine phosphatase family protein n=1 Tax=Actomonas aquatica TaxID=2866162 RepID=A0ABZ1C3W9_9BACT|nr:histidine phosphatase family protein [Opitutus sp. WL0086]WRQ86146.1 histidine phosphatase family protein [Opitutus sp. WL0086]